MSGVIVKLEKGDRAAYLEWSISGSIPSTMGTTLAAFKAYYKDRYGSDGLRKLEANRLPYVEKYGCSSHVNSLQDLMRYHYADQWGHRPILMGELWDRYVDGEICAECEEVYTFQEMTSPDGNSYRDASGEEVCFFCANKIDIRPWPEVLGVPDEIGGGAAWESKHGAPLLDIRADPTHSLRKVTWSLVQRMHKGHSGKPEFDQAQLDMALEQARKELA